jgi:hypothetical protein
MKNEDIAVSNFGDCETQLLGTSFIKDNFCSKQF